MKLRRKRCDLFIEYLLSPVNHSFTLHSLAILFALILHRFWKNNLFNIRTKHPTPSSAPETDPTEITP